MKTVTIQSVKYKIVDYTTKSKYIKTMIFTFQIDNKEFDVKITDLEKYAFSLVVPHTDLCYNITKFKSLDDNTKIKRIDILCRACTNYSFEVSTYKDFIFNENVEESINQKVTLKCCVEEISRDLSIDNFKFINFESNSEFELFKIKLIHYYANQERVKKLKSLYTITNSII